MRVLYNGSNLLFIFSSIIIMLKIWSVKGWEKGLTGTFSISIRLIKSHSTCVDKQLDFLTMRLGKV